MTQLQGAGEDKAGLWHGAFCRIDQQNDSVDHLQNTLHLAAKVGVARSVHDVDLHIAVLNGGILCQNGNATFAL
ncbi:hypothetical protein SDC9_162029 [bioreactor metagenome]|uniref:Uncharacterized protein n=1 Tax=bioreactor metagenome TaxID=1076179 RepID=A0A645FMC4_9ZZZZ